MRHTMLHRKPGIPLFFKLWFAFILVVVLGIWGFVIYVGASVASDPASIGRAAGEIMRGYNETKE